MKAPKKGRPEIKPGYSLIRTTVALPADMYVEVKAEANINNEGNISELMREIFEERYGLNKKKKKPVDLRVTK